MNDRYATYRKALELGAGRELSREHMESLGFTTEPLDGFWRCRAYKDGPFVPVAIFFAEGKQWVLKAGEPARDPEQTWTYCSRWPISEELFYAVSGGTPWPEEPPARNDNLPKTGDACVDLQAEFVAEQELALGFLKKPVATQEQADQIAIWSKRVGGILSKADTDFAVEKRPWIDGGKAVDERWRWRQDASALVKKLKASLDGWLNELDRRERERQRIERERAAELRAQAEEAERRAAEAAVKAEQDGIATLFQREAEEQADKLQEQAAAADREAQARKTSAGRTGAKVSLRTFVSAEITDFDALLTALKDRPEIKELVQTLANRAAKSGIALSGMKITEERRAA